MPNPKYPIERGRLVVQFSVIFPPDNWLSADKITELEKYLPERQEVMIPDEAEECLLQKYDPRQDQYRGNRSVYDSDDEDQMGPRVQCASH